MSPDPVKAKAIFLQAVEEHEPSEWGAFLDEACGDNPELRREVEVLLAAHAQAGAFLEDGAVARDATIEQPITEKPGAVIGSYKLLQKIGEGGYGVVYMADQAEPVKRRVALKIIKPGMDTRQVIARFEAERQALALMDHPNIARVLDAGATDSGRPYFVMELVKGVPITQFCDEKHLTPRERLELFLPVCQAVQHAHQKGVIHRDIKPTNVLVAKYDDRPVPKVIDFGVAKATEQRLTEKTMFTQFGQIVGTVDYMSPEQADLNQLDIDTRSDIYSLGVVLYELLTGETPFDRRRLHSAAFDELLRIIREEQPPRPSLRLSTSESLPSIAANRHIEPKKLSALVRGELDWIVMTALEKDRARRYETANGFARDIQRYLNDEPVLASPPSTIYRFRKFVSRNKAAMATAGLVTGALLLGLTISTWQAVRATKAERLAAARLERLEKADDTKMQLLAKVQHERDRAEAQRDENRRLLYTSDMARALRAWEDGIIPQVDELVERHRPKPGEEDLRGFEWYYLWRLRGQRMAVTTLQHSSAVFSMDFPPDGNSLATAGVDGSVAVWDIATCQPRFQHHPDVGNIGPAIVFSPDGLTVASVDIRVEKGKARVVRLWDTATGRLKETLDMDEAPPVVFTPDGQLAFSPDGSLLAVACSSGAVQLWDVAEGKSRDPLVTQGSRPTRLAFGPGGKQIASQHEDGTVRLWDVETRQSQELAGSEYCTRSLAFSPDGKTLACGDEDGTIRLWDVATTGQRATLPISDRPVTSVVFSPDGNTLVSLSPSVKLWDLRSEKLLGRIRGAWISIAVSPDGKTLASGAVDNTVRLWRMEPDDEGTVLTGHTEVVPCVAISPDGELVASSALDGQLKLWDAITGCERATLKNGAICLAFSRDGKFLASQLVTGPIAIWDVATGTRLRELDHPYTPGQGPRSIALSPDGTILARGDALGEIVLCDVSTGAFREPLRKRPGAVVGLDFSPGGEMLAATVEREAVEMWAVATEKLEHRLGDQIEPCGLPAFSPDGRVLACGCFDGAVRLWDTSTGSWLSTLEGHAGQVSSVVFLADGITFLSAGYDGTIRLWDMEMLRQRASLRTSGGPILSIAASLDGNVLVSGGLAGTVRLWRAAAEEDPQKLIDILQLETRLRDIPEADAYERQKTLVDMEVRLAGKVDVGLTRHDLALADSAIWAVASGGDHALAAEVYSRFAKVIERADDQRSRDLAERWERLSWEHRGRHHAEQNEWEDAVGCFTKAIEFEPGVSGHRARRAEGHAILGRWDEAAADWAQVVQSDREDSRSWCGVAALQLLAGNTEAYKTACREAFQQPSGDYKWLKAYLVQMCSLAPDCGIDRKELTRLTERFLIEDDYTVMPLTKGMDAYRSGRLEEALAHLRPGGDAWVRAPVRFFRAMAYQRLGDTQQARRELSEGIKAMEETCPTITGPPLLEHLPERWIVWCFMEVIRREAYELIGQAAAERTSEAGDRPTPEAE